MTSVVMEEFLKLCNVKQVLGAAFTPRHQGPGERKHIELMKQWLILIHKVCQTFPQDWDVLAPVASHSSIATRSYVWPSAAETGKR